VIELRDDLERRGRQARRRGPVLESHVAACGDEERESGERGRDMAPV
jgi:hypothetical protein